MPIYVKKFRSPRLQEQEGIRVVGEILIKYNISPDYVCSDIIFKKRWEYDILQQWDSTTPHCRCGFCDEAQREEEDELLSYLPWSEPMQKEIAQAIVEDFDEALGEAAEMPFARTLIFLGYFRFLHGLGRDLLKNPVFRAEIKSIVRSDLPSSIIARGYLSSNDQHLLDVCWALASIIDDHEFSLIDEDGFNIFHGH
jgi:hypothetical protein